MVIISVNLENGQQNGVHLMLPVFAIGSYASKALLKPVSLCQAIIEGDQIQVADFSLEYFSDLTGQISYHPGPMRTLAQ